MTGAVTGLLHRGGMVPLVLSAGLLAPAAGDTVELNGGRTLDGIIVEETPDTVVLDIGMGEMSFARDRIVRVHRSSDDDNQQTRKRWDLRYIGQSDLPDDLHALYRDWDRLRAIRARATQDAGSLGRDARERSRLQVAILATRAEYDTVSRALADMSLKQDVSAYNAKVEKNNELVARMSRQRESLEASEQRSLRTQESISRYARELTRFEMQFQSASHRYSDDATHEIARAWLGRTGGELESMQGDFARISVPVTGGAGGTLLDVELNGRETARYILDTGASIVTLTETMARKLNLTYDPSQPIELRLADGKTSEGYPVVLDSVAVGEARAEQVRAVVVPTAPGPGIEGLLGMSFLSRFEMSFDAVGNQLKLQRLRDGP